MSPMAETHDANRTSCAPTSCGSSPPTASRCRRCRGSTCGSTPARWWPSSARRARASRRCSRSSPGLDTATAGVARVAGHDLLAMGSRERVAYQRRTVGFVWQQTSRNLLPYLTAAENVALAMNVARHAPRRGARAAGRRAARAASSVGEARDRRPAELSGGQQQRVAIAVALANAPAGAARRRADRRARRGDVRRGARGDARRERGARRHDAHRHPRPDGVGSRAAHGADPRRPHLDRGAALHPRRRARRRAARRRGVRRARPGGPAPAAARLRAGPRSCATACGSPSNPTTWACGPATRGRMPRPAGSAEAASPPTRPPRLTMPRPRHRPRRRCCAAERPPRPSRRSPHATPGRARRPPHDPRRTDDDAPCRIREPRVRDPRRGRACRRRRSRSRCAPASCSS